MKPVPYGILHADFREGGLSDIQHPAWLFAVVILGVVGGHDLGRDRDLAGLGGAVAGRFRSWSCRFALPRLLL